MTTAHRRAQVTGTDVEHRAVGTVTETGDVAEPRLRRGEGVAGVILRGFPGVRTVVGLGAFGRQAIPMEGVPPRGGVDIDG